MRTMKELLAVGFGCAVGAVARYAINGWLDDVMMDALAILIINLLGCLLMGVFTGWIASRRPSPTLAKMLTTGLCGGLTTFSTFSSDTFELLRVDAGPALLIVAVSLIGGMAMYLLGRRLTRATKRDA